VNGSASKFAERRPKIEDGVCGRTFTHDKNGDERNEACHQYHFFLRPFALSQLVQLTLPSVHIWYTWLPLLDEIQS
jgi:hypothetical protein